MTSSIGLDGAVWLGIVALGMSACASGRASGDGPGRIRGRVVAPDGSALDGVRITTEPPTDAVLTFEGSYEITRIVKTKTPVAPGTYTVLPYKLGWWRGRQAPDIKVEHKGGDTVVPDIELQPIVGPTMDDLSAPADRDAQPQVPGAGVIRDGE